MALVPPIGVELALRFAARELEGGKFAVSVGRLDPAAAGALDDRARQILVEGLERALAELADGDRLISRTALERVLDDLTLTEHGSSRQGAALLHTLRERLQIAHNRD